MSKKYDAGMKVLLETHLVDWLALVPRKPTGPMRIIDSDIATVSAATDKVLWIDDPVPWILHVELQSKRDPSLELRVPWYNAILEYKHRCLVHSLVVLLTKNAETPGLTGEWQRGFEGEKPYRYLRYQVVRVRELHAADLAKGGWGMFPLAPLCDDAKPASMHRLIRQMGQRVIREHPDPAAAKELWATTADLLGLRFDDPLLDELMKEMTNMIDLSESKSYQRRMAQADAEGLAKGMARGIAEGMAKAKAQAEAEVKADALRDIILRQGKKKFGKPSAKVVRELNGIADEGRLTELSERILDVDSWKDLLAHEG
jgi:hypothetical protein